MILAIIQARMSSNRLPGKVLMDIAGKPMLERVVNVAKDAELVDDVCIATSGGADDRQIVKLAERMDVKFYTGDLKNVLERYYYAALQYMPAHVVRLTGDCPLLQSALIDEVIRHHLRYNYEYTSNNDFVPSGMNVEVFTMNALTRAAKLAVDPYDQEHVTPYMQNSWFDKGEYPNYDGPNVKLSVDTPEDYERINKLAGRVSNE